MKHSALVKNITSQEVDPGFAQRADFILGQIIRNKPKKILETGCGRGFYMKTLSLLDFPKKIVGIDVSKEYVAKAQEITKNDKRVTISQGSIYEIPYVKNSFDCVICSEVLEHLDDDVAAVKEIYRVLRPGGVALISVPHHSFPFFWDPLNWVLMKFGTHIPKDIWWLAGIWADHERLYTDKELRTALKKGGLTPSRIKKFVHWAWPFSHFFLYGIGKNLVERGGATGFDRFNFKEDKKFARFLSYIVGLPSRLLDKRIPTKRAVILGVSAKKK